MKYIAYIGRFLYKSKNLSKLRDLGYLRKTRVFLEQGKAGPPPCRLGRLARFVLFEGPHPAARPARNLWRPEAPQQKQIWPAGQAGRAGRLPIPDMIHIFTSFIPFLHIIQTTIYISIWWFFSRSGWPIFPIVRSRWANF